jgi:putative endonuclease
VACFLESSPCDLFEFHRRFRFLDPSTQAARPRALAFARQTLQTRKKLRSRATTKNGFVMFYVYVLHSDKDAGLYIGYSTDLRKRLLEHKTGMAFATSYRAPWKLVYYEAYADSADAKGREVFLKSGSGRRFLMKQLAYYFQKHPFRPAA